VHGKEAVGAVYSDIIAAIPDVNFVSTRRFTSEDGQWVVDESNVTGHVHGQWAGIDGGGAPVEVRILHLFRLRDGLIEYENTWFDSAAISRQVSAWKGQQAGS
jgi:predicted ester cyclase